MDGAPGEAQIHVHPLSPAVAQRGDGELPGVVEREELDLLPVRVERLPEVALLPEDPYADERDAEVAGAP